MSSRACLRRTNRCLVSPLSAIPFRRFIGLLLALALAGCAGGMAYREGQQLVAQDNVEAGLLKFKEATTADPGNAQYRLAYLRARDAAVLRYLEAADAQVDAGKTAAAAATFRRVLALDPANERARSGLSGLEMMARHEKLIAAAQAALEKKDAGGARQRLMTVLAERPTHEKARALLSAIGEKEAVNADPDAGLNQMFKKPISIQFKDAQLRQVFEVISRSSGLNFIFDKDVKLDQRTSIFLKDSSIELAVYYLLVTNQLERQVVGDNTVLIYPSTAAKVKEYQELVVKTFFIANADAKVIANSLKTILKSRDVAVDEKLNLVIVRDSREAIRLAEKLVNLQDIAEPEVMLDVEILEVTTSRLLDLGVTWPSSISLTPLTTTGGAAVTLADLRDLNESRIGITTPTIIVGANKKDGDTNILANPRIRVRNREKARVLIGEKAPQITTTISPGAGGFASESVTYVDVGLTLNVEPTIYLNNEVGIKIALEVSNLLGQVQTKTRDMLKGAQVADEDIDALLASGLSMRAFPDAVSALTGVDYRAKLAAVSQPVVLVNGDQDHVMLQQEADFIATARRGQHRRFDCEHGVSLLCSAQFAGLINEFALGTALSLAPARQ